MKLAQTNSIEVEHSVLSEEAASMLKNIRRLVYRGGLGGGDQVWVEAQALLVISSFSAMWA